MSALHTPDDGLEFDLDAARVARRESKGTPGLRIGGKRLDLPAELPVDVLAPLTELDVDASLLVSMVLDAQAEAAEGGGQEKMLGALVNIVIANPKLPTDLVDAVKVMARRLLGDEGYEHLVACRLRLPELGELAKFIGRVYGVSLGEASPPSDSSEGTGTTPSATSSGSTDSTSAASGESPAPQGS